MNTKSVFRMLSVLLLVCLLVGTQIPALAEDPYIPSEITFQMSENIGSRNINLEGVKDVSAITKLKSSNPKVATLSKFEYEGTAYVAIEPKSPGKTTVTFNLKHNGKTIKAKVAVTVLKYVNPFKSLKIGTKSCASLFKKTDMAHTYKTLKGRITYKLKKGWKLRTVSSYNGSNGSDYKHLDPKKSIKVKKGYRLSFGLSYNDGPWQEYWIAVE